MQRNTTALILLIALVVLDVVVWYEVVLGRPADTLQLHFLDVGQGDAQLVTLEGGVTMLIDAGRGSAALGELGEVLPARRKYIDLAIVSHPQIDHFGGFVEILHRYRVGAVVVSGRVPDDPLEAWEVFIETVEKKGVPLIVLGAGDRIEYGEANMEVLSPDPLLAQSGELNDTSLVLLLDHPDLRALFTGDIGMAVEEHLVDVGDIRADVLKVSHHGSKYSSSEAFINAVDPAIAVIGVGQNRYGHPTEEALARLEAVGTRLFRTDRNGMVGITIKDGVLRVVTER